MRPFKTSAILSLVGMAFILLGLTIAVVSLAGTTDDLGYALTYGDFGDSMVGGVIVGVLVAFLGVIAGLAGTIFAIIGYFKLSKVIKLFSTVAILIIATLVIGWIPIVGSLVGTALAVVQGIAFIQLSKLTKKTLYHTYAILLFVSTALGFITGVSLLVPVIGTMMIIPMGIAFLAAAIMYLVVLFRLDDELEAKPVKKI